MKLRYKVVPVTTILHCPSYAVVDTIDGGEAVLGQFDCSYWASKKAQELNRIEEEKEKEKNAFVTIRKSKKQYIRHR